MIDTSPLNVVLPRAQAAAPRLTPREAVSENQLADACISQKNQHIPASLSSRDAGVVSYLITCSNGRNSARRRSWEKRRRIELVHHCREQPSIAGRPVLVRALSARVRKEGSQTCREVSLVQIDSKNANLSVWTKSSCPRVVPSLYPLSSICLQKDLSASSISVALYAHMAGW